MQYEIDEKHGQPDTNNDHNVSGLARLTTDNNSPCTPPPSPPQPPPNPPPSENFGRIFSSNQHWDHVISTRPATGGNLTDRSASQSVNPYMKNSYNPIYDDHEIESWEGRRLRKGKPDEQIRTVNPACVQSGWTPVNKRLEKMPIQNQARLGNSASTTCRPKHGRWKKIRAEIHLLITWSSSLTAQSQEISLVEIHS